MAAGPPASRPGASGRATASVLSRGHARTKSTGQHRQAARPATPRHRRAAPLLGQELHQRGQRGVHRPVGVDAHHVSPRARHAQPGASVTSRPLASSSSINGARPSAMPTPAAAAATHRAQAAQHQRILAGAFRQAQARTPGAPVGFGTVDVLFLQPAVAREDRGVVAFVGRDQRRTTTPAPRFPSSAGYRPAPPGAGRGRARAGRPGRCPALSRQGPGWRAGTPGCRCPGAVR